MQLLFLQTNVFNVGYSQIVKILQDEIQARNIMELKAKPVVWVLIEVDSVLSQWSL